jgi:hypothetical protein
MATPAYPNRAYNQSYHAPYLSVRSDIAFARREDHPISRYKPARQQAVSGEGRDEAF